jgi:hypothetical protein
MCVNVLFLDEPPYTTQFYDKPTLLCMFLLEKLLLPNAYYYNLGYTIMFNFAYLLLEYCFRCCIIHNPAYFNFAQDNFVWV